jgi:hypothetical protein
MSVLNETLCEHLECGDLHTKIYMHLDQISEQRDGTQ